MKGGSEREAEVEVEEEEEESSKKRELDYNGMLKTWSERGASLRERTGQGRERIQYGVCIVIKTYRVAMDGDGHNGGSSTAAAALMMMKNEKNRC